VRQRWCDRRQWHGVGIKGGSDSRGPWKREGDCCGPARRAGPSGKRWVEVGRWADPMNIVVSYLTQIFKLV
jgi:hypothetical protein